MIWEGGAVLEVPDVEDLAVKRRMKVKKREIPVHIQITKTLFS
jgi:hypothetical protein